MTSPAVLRNSLFPPPRAHVYQPLGCLLSLHAGCTLMGDSRKYYYAVARYLTAPAAG